MSLPSDPAQSDRVTDGRPIYDKKFDRYFQAVRRGADLIQAEYELGQDGKEIFRDTHKIEYVIGSGANGSTDVIRRGGYLFEAPLSYYSKAGAWGLSPGFEFADYGFTRAIEPACVACHSGRAQPVPNRIDSFRDPPFSELAIGCENCHGPGQLHVAERKNGSPLTAGVDHTIVNPAKLPGWLADNICMNCHQGEDVRILQPGKDDFDFRPGTPLDETTAIFLVPFTRATPPHDPLLQHYASMVLSKCYRASDGRLACITCHDPHQQPNASEAPGYYRKKCLECHIEKACKIPLQARIEKSLPNDCAGCHMPKQNLERISHSSLTNHRIIAREGEAFPEMAFDPTSPGSPGLMHLDAVPGKANDAIPPVTLVEAYGELLSSHPEFEARYSALLDQVAKTNPDNAFVLSALARRAARQRTPQADAKAIQFLYREIDQGSAFPSDYELLAKLLAKSGQTPKAIAILKRSIASNPYAAWLYRDLAMCYTSVQQYSAALEAMKKELELFPEDSNTRALVEKVEESK